MTDDTDLFEHAPCGYVVATADGTITRVNATFERWSGLARDALIGRRFADLLTPAGRIYHETHYAPLLRMQGMVSEIALEIVAADGTRLPALITSITHGGEVRTAVFDASDRRRYEQELLAARRREQNIATELQRSMLGGELPRSERLEVGVVYRPAERGLEVGGDWYDAFPLDEGDTVGLVVGDVVGRGLTAAATMGQLRSAVRALASTQLGPGALLGALDRYAERHSVGAATTLVHVQLELASGTACYAAAGHPPPLLLHADGSTGLLWGGRSTPLNAALTASERPEDSLTLAPGATLVLYSDGLVERRGRSLDDGMDALARAAAAHAGEPLEAFAAALVRECVEEALDDDVCVLAARRPA